MNIWLTLAAFCYRRAFTRGSGEPDGIPYRRSAEAPCLGYEPRKRRLGDWGDCESDGHYLCRGCTHKAIADELLGKEEAK